MAGTGLLIGIFGMVFYLFVLLLPIALLVALQVWLCKKGTKLGLILPGLSLALSLMLVFSLAAFGSLTVSAGNTGAGPIEGGAYIEVPAQEGAARGGMEKPEFPVRTLISAGVLFLIMNIPTAVFGGIWLHYKGRRDTYEDLKKMRIKDLE